MPGCGVSPSARHKRWIHAALWSAYATGIAWMVLHYAVNRGDVPESGWRVCETWMLRAHGAAAMAALAVFGSMLPVHIPSAWRLKSSLASGITLLASLSVFAVTGWLLYYASGDLMRAASSGAHMGLGVVSPLALLWHVAQRSSAARLAEGPAAARRQAAARAARLRSCSCR